ncbi:MAG: hypothetical protein AB4050_08730 [Synechococcus sp.]
MSESLGLEGNGYSFITCLIGSVLNTGVEITVLIEKGDKTVSAICELGGVVEHFEGLGFVYDDVAFTAVGGSFGGARLVLTISFEAVAVVDICFPDLFVDVR